MSKEVNSPLELNGKSLHASCNIQNNADVSEDGKLKHTLNNASKRTVNLSYKESSSCFNGKNVKTVMSSPNIQVADHGSKDLNISQKQNSKVEHWDKCLYKEVNLNLLAIKQEDSDHETSGAGNHSVSNYEAFPFDDMKTEDNIEGDSTIQTELCPTKSPEGHSSKSCKKRHSKRVLDRSIIREEKKHVSQKRIMIPLQLDVTQVCTSDEIKQCDIIEHEDIADDEIPPPAKKRKKIVNKKSSVSSAESKHAKPDGKYECDCCRKNFAFKSSLMKHLKKAHDVDNSRAPMEFPCLSCSQVFTSRTLLKQHCKEIHVCDYRFSQITSQWECELCQAMFNNRSLLRKHQTKQCLKVVNGRYRCQHCENRFKSKETLLSHHKKKHFQSVNANEKKRWKCLQCTSQEPVYYHSQEQLKEHVTNQHPPVDSRKLALLDEEETEKTLDWDQKLVECRLCGEQISLKDGMNEHLKAVHDIQSEYWCGVPGCSKTFQTFKHLHTHRKRCLFFMQHMGTIVCKLCDKKCLTSKQLKCHIKEFHRTAKKYKCQGCENISTGAHEFMIHKSQCQLFQARKKRLTKGKGGVCNLCGKKFELYTGFLNHMKYTHAEPHLQCPFCENKYKQKISFLYHVCTHDEIEDRQYNGAQEIEENMNTEELEKYFQCPFCLMRFLTPEYTKDHILTLHNTKSKQRPRYNHDGTLAKFRKEYRGYCYDPEKYRMKCERKKAQQEVKKEEVKAKPPKSPQPLLQCEVCASTYKTQSGLANHLASTHYQEVFASCTECVKQFYSESSYKAHMRRVHDQYQRPNNKPPVTKCPRNTGQPPGPKRPRKRGQCKICDKQMSQSALTKHMDIHLGIFRFACNQCEKKCRSSYDLKVHLRTHSGEKPFSCALCHKSFGDVSNMRNHESRVHGKTSVVQEDNVTNQSSDALLSCTNLS